MQCEFLVYRDVRDKGLRKVSVILLKREEGLVHVIDRTLMFAGLGFERRLARRKARMLKRAQIMVNASENVELT